jgi:hypothetical protein
MKKLLSALTVLAMATPAMATPARVVNPGEPMVVVPGLEVLGPNRLSTVQWCQKVEGTNDWRKLITDSDFELMEGCLIEHT